MKNEKGIIHFLPLVGLGIIALVFVLMASRSNNLFIKTGETYPQLLINHVSNFDEITLGDLPDVGKYPRIYDHNGNKIFEGSGKIVEYNLETNSYIRMSDRNVLNCGYRTVKFDNYLYSSCNLSQKFPSNSSLPYGQVFKIDLNSGKLVKRYFQEFEPIVGEMSRSELLVALDKKDGRLINPYLAKKDNNLWISSWDGVLKMNVNTDAMTKYTNSDIFGNGCYPSGIFNDSGAITVTATRGTFCAGASSVLDESSNKWNLRTFGSNLTDSYENWDKYIKDEGFFQLIEPEKNLPNFYYISQLHNNKYYLVASDGIYTREGQFSQKGFLSRNKQSRIWF